MGRDQADYKCAAFRLHPFALFCLLPFTFCLYDHETTSNLRCRLRLLRKNSATRRVVDKSIEVDIKGWQFIPERMTRAWPYGRRWHHKSRGLSIKNGRLTGGAEAINEALRYIWWARPLAPLYKVPGIRQLQDRAYQLDRRQSPPHCPAVPMRVLYRKKEKE